MPARLTAARAVSFLLPCFALLGGTAGISLADSISEAAQAAFDRGLLLFDEARKFAAANATRRDEITQRYELAGKSFVAAAEAGARSTEVFTNAANSFSFGGRTAEAVLYYLRALAVDPANVRAREALEHLRSGLPMKRPAAGTAASIIKSLFFWHEGLTLETRKAGFLFFFPAAFLFFAASLRRRRPFVALGVLCLVPALALLGSLLVDAVSGSLRKQGVIMVQVEGRKGDGLTYSPSHSRPFPAGTEVAIELVRTPVSESAGNEDSWALVRLLDGSESWVPERAVERVLP